MPNKNNTYNFLEVKFQELSSNVNTWIKDLYNKSNINLSPASPYGHILQAITKLFESSLIYLKSVTSQFDINNPTNENAKMVRSLARIGGYNPSLSLSATGTIALQLRPSIEINEFGNGEIVIMNGTKIVNNSNNLDYFIDLGGIEYATFKVEKNKKIYLPIVQGKLETQEFTGNGRQNQSLSIQLANSKTVEQYRTTVMVDSQLCDRVEHLYDMLPDQKAWYGRTGIDSAFDIYFGTNDFGFIPQRSDNISVKYVISDGNSGNIPAKLVDDFTFSDDVYDGNGISTDILQNFFIYIEDEISLGANSESVTFTKSILPYNSRNFVLARPENFIFMLKRLNYFSQIDAFTTEKGTELDNQDPKDDSVVYIFLVPNIALYLTGNNSYFDLDLNAFYLDDSEKEKINTFLKTQGTIAVGTSTKILDPVITKYVINISLRIFEDAIEDNIRAEILNKLSTHFGNFERRGRIDKSSVIKIIEEIDGVDSVLVEFVSEQNESYHKEYVDYKESIMKENPTIDPDTIVLEGYEEDKVLGLDPELGDIVFKKNELPIIRGGFYTREGLLFKETPSTTGVSSVNIMIKGVSKNKLF